MNERPWPTLDQIGPVNVGAQGQAEVQQNFAALNALITQFNQLVATEGSLAMQIRALIARCQEMAGQLSGIYPYDGTSEHDSGYISNSLLKAWPNADWILGATATGPLIDVAISESTPSVTLTAAAGALYVLGGGTGGGIVYFDASKNAGIGEATGDVLVLGAGGNDVLTFTPSATPTAVFSADAGAVYVLGGTVGGSLYFDLSANAGIGETAGGNLVLGAGGDDVLTFVPGATPSTTFSADAGALFVLDGRIYLDAANYFGIGLDAGNLRLGATGGLVVTDVNLEVDGGSVWLDADHYFGIAINTGDLELGATGGMVFTSEDFQAGGYKASDGTPGASTTTGGATFKDGLFTSGTITGSGDPGTVEEVPYTAPPDNDFYLRFNDTGPGSTNGSWANLNQFFRGIEAATYWPGSEDIEEVGVVNAGTWEADQIELGYLADIAGETILGNDTANPTIPTALTVEEVRVLLELDDVENTALSTWVGTTNVTTLGTITTGTWHGSQIADAYLASGSTFLKANQTITLSGNVTGSGTTAITTTIAAAVVTLAMMANLAANSIIGNNTGSAATPLALTASQVKTLLSLNNVENTALSTWAGSTNITQIGNATGINLNLSSMGTLTAGECHTATFRGIAGVVGGQIYFLPATDSATAIVFQNAAQTANPLIINTVSGILVGSFGLQTPVIRAYVDGANGIRFQNAAGSIDVLTIDTTTGIMSSPYGVYAPQIRAYTDGPSGLVFASHDGTSLLMVSTITGMTRSPYGLIAPEIRAYTNSSAGLVLASTNGTVALRIDTDNRICYPTRLVIPGI